MKVQKPFAEISPRGVVEAGLELLQKPFTADVLAQKIWAAVHAHEAPSRQLEIDTHREGPS